MTVVSRSSPDRESDFVATDRTGFGANPSCANFCALETKVTGSATLPFLQNTVANECIRLVEEHLGEFSI